MTCFFHGEIWSATPPDQFALFSLSRIWGFFLCDDCWGFFVKQCKARLKLMADINLSLMSRLSTQKAEDDEFLSCILGCYGCKNSPSQNRSHIHSTLLKCCLTFTHISLNSCKSAFHYWGQDFLAKWNSLGSKLVKN